MARGSFKIALDNLQEMIDELNRWDVDKKTTKKRNKTIVSNLDQGFWDMIREKIKKMLVSNYNRIRITNKPKYYAWKQKARAAGLSVQVTKGGEEAPVQYIRPALRTGTLRQRLSEVQLRTRNPVRRTGGSSVEYIVSVGDLYKDYGIRMRNLILEQTGQDILLLNEDQLSEVFELVINAIEGSR